MSDPNGVSPLVEVRVKSLGLDRSSNTPVVILEEIEGERVLLIWIGPGEASAIAMHLADMKYHRPLTHDLLANVIESFGGRLNEVKISLGGPNLYIAEMVCQRGDEVLTVDARPSDSIAVALRLNAKIFADDDLLGDALLDMENYEPPDALTGADDVPKKKKKATAKKGKVAPKKKTAASPRSTGPRKK